MSSCESPRLIERLRRSTRQLHRQVEGRLAPEQGWTSEQYARVLRMSYAVIAPVEGALCRVLGDLFEAPPPASRVDRLRSDLAALGCELPPALARSVTSQPDAFGTAYVLQGSLLGGALIVKQARTTVGASLPTAYLELYGAALPAIWKRFCAATDAFGSRASLTEQAAVVDAALHTFAAHTAALDSLA